MDCERLSDRCNNKDVSMRKSLTAYHFDGKINSPEDPNKDVAMCSICYDEYTEYWKSMWDEYNASRF